MVLVRISTMPNSGRIADACLFTLKTPKAMSELQVASAGSACLSRAAADGGARYEPTRSEYQSACQCEEPI